MKYENKVRSITYFFGLVAILKRLRNVAKKLEKKNKCEIV